MDRLNRQDLQELAAHEAEQCISFYMPAERVEAEHAQNSIRFKNVLRDVRLQLQERGLKDAAIDETLQPATDLLDDATLWRSMSEGFCGFITPDTHLFLRLPLRFDEVAHVSNHFYLKPLFPLIASNNRFHVLALSQNSVRLFRGTHQGLDQVDEGTIPEGIAEALAYDDPEQQLQVRSHRTANDQAGESEAIFHGQGSGEQEFRSKPQERLKRYFREVDSSVKELLKGDRAPLVLAGVSYYLPIYREVNSYPHLITDEIAGGNPDQLAPHELHEKTWQIVDPHFQAAQEEAVERFQAAFQQDNGHASAALEDVIRSSMFGRVDTLFTPVHEFIWGSADKETGEVVLHGAQQEDSTELLNMAAIHTFTNGGTVYALKPEHMPVDEPAAATYRYAADLSTS